MKMLGFIYFDQILHTVTFFLGRFAVERLPALHCSVSFIFLPFGFHLGTLNLSEGH